MKRLIGGFILGVVATASFTLSAPVFTQNLQTFLHGGLRATVTLRCDSTRRRCVYERIEQGLGINDVQIVAIYMSSRLAETASLLWPRVDCEPAAELAYNWTETALMIRTLHNSGDCEVRGIQWREITGFDVLVNNG